MTFDECECVDDMRGAFAAVTAIVVAVAAVLFKFKFFPDRTMKCKKKEGGGGETADNPVAK